MLGFKKILVVAAAAAAALLGLSALAWACTQSAYLEPILKPSPAGSLVGVSGDSFNSGPVEIRWDSAKGKVLGQASGPSFSVSVATPADAAPGVYYLVAVQTDPSGAVLGRGATPVEISASPQVSNSGIVVSGGGFKVGSQQEKTANRAPASSSSGTEQSLPRTDAPNGHTIGADLWSGFSGNSGPSLEAAPQTTAFEGNGAGIATGVAVLGAGILGLAAAGVAMRSGRRSRA